MRKEEILLTFPGWGPQYPELPVSLIIYDKRRMDLHAQTGKGHPAAIEKAKEILKKRGLFVGAAEMMGPTGIYYPVRRSKKEIAERKCHSKAKGN